MATRPIIGLNKYRDGDDEAPEVKLTRTPRAKQQLQVDRLRKFKKKNADKANRALDKLAAVADAGKNRFSRSAGSSRSLFVRPDHRAFAGSSRPFPPDGVAHRSTAILAVGLAGVSPAEWSIVTFTSEKRAGRAGFEIA